MATVRPEGLGKLEKIHLIGTITGIALPYYYYYYYYYYYTSFLEYIKVMLLL
jgi:hypothetical protein